VRIARCGSYAAWYVASAKTASRISAVSPVTIGISDRPCSQSGFSIPTRSQIVG